MIRLNDSILITIKNMLGITKDYNVFDSDLIVHINSTFTILSQLGIGPEQGFSISGDEEIWADFLEEKTNYEFIKTFIYLKVRLAFDPPTNSFLVTAIEKQISELEWRLYMEAEGDEKNES